jgi:hypothetical protein
VSPDRPHDPELERAFQAMRAEDRLHTPDVARMLARARADAARATPMPPPHPFRRRSWIRWGIPGVSVALAAALAAILLTGGEEPPVDDFDRVVLAYVESSASWHSPTDALLRVPGDEMLRTVPRVGARRPPPRDPNAPPPDGLELESPS